MHFSRALSAAAAVTKVWLARALLIFGGLALLWTIYGWVMPETLDIPPKTLSSLPDTESRHSAVTLAANLDAPLLDGNSIRLLENGTEIFPAMLDSVRHARHSVNLLSYVYWTGDIAVQFADVLSAAARRGVEVRVLVDAFGGRKMDPALLDEMRAAGCKFAWFHPVRWYSLRRFNNRTHRKILVTDGRVGFTGGVGIASEWTGNAQDPTHWRDDQFRIEGPAVRYLQGSFAENWRQATGEVLAGPKMFPDLAPFGDVTMVPLNAAPFGTTSSIAFTYWVLFHSARNEVLVATPYYLPDPDLELGMEEAARRGVKVTLLVPGPHQDSALVGYASRTYYRELLESGVRIFEFQPTMMHVKTVSVDGAWAVIGSANFDSRSFTLNYEAVVAVYDRNFVRQLNASFAHDLTRSRQVRLADLTDEPLWAKVRNYLAVLLRAQL